MYRFKIKNKHIIFIVISLIIIILFIFSFTLKEDRQLNKVESLIKDTTLSITTVVGYPFRLIFNKIDDFNNLVNIREKYQEILPEVKRVESLKAENIELRKQLESMKEELSIDYTINEYSYLNATVINRNVSYWYNTITIDKGTYNGVEVNQVVVNSDGLIGKIVSATTFTSDVKLLTTNDSFNKISVSITNGKNKLYGLIKTYNNHTDYLEIEGISNTDKVNIDDYVYTSGLGGVFPSGILIGKVTEITTDEYDLSKIINVKPVANFDNLNYVAILKRKENTK